MARWRHVERKEAYAFYHSYQWEKCKYDTFIFRIRTSKKAYSFEQLIGPKLKLKTFWTADPKRIRRKSNNPYNNI